MLAIVYYFIEPKISTEFLQRIIESNGCLSEPTDGQALPLEQSLPLRRWDPAFFRVEKVQFIIFVFKKTLCILLSVFEGVGLKCCKRNVFCLVNS